MGDDGGRTAATQGLSPRPQEKYFARSGGGYDGGWGIGEMERWDEETLWRSEIHVEEV